MINYKTKLIETGGRMSALCFASVKREKHSSQRRWEFKWDFMDVRSLFLPVSRYPDRFCWRQPAIEWLQKCHPGSQGHQPPLPNQCTSSLHKQNTLLVYIHLRLFVSSLSKLVPYLFQELKLIELPSVCFTSLNKCTGEKESLWILRTDWSFC